MDDSTDRQKEQVHKNTCIPLILHSSLDNLFHYFKDYVEDIDGKCALQLLTKV